MLRKPYLVNDVQAQDTLLDRRRVYRTLMVSAGAAGGACAASAASSGLGPWTSMLPLPLTCVALCAWPALVCYVLCAGQRHPCAPAHYCRPLKPAARPDRSRWVWAGLRCGVELYHRAALYVLC